MQGTKAQWGMESRRWRRAAWAVAAGLMASLAIVPAAHAKTYVSFTFDDGSSDQYAVKEMLGKHGMPATFYVNSGQVGTSAYYMNWDQLTELYQAGHEIGGHTLHHENSGAQTAEQQRDAICQDRNNLLSRGFAATSFAYTYGTSNVSRAVVQGCGYNSGQVAGGLKWGSECTRCPSAEQLPPKDPYYVRSVEIRAGMTGAQLAGFIEQSKPPKGEDNWIVFPFNRVCDGCSPYGIAPAQLADLIERVQAMVVAGDADVVTVQQAVRGQLQPVPPSGGTSGGPAQSAPLPPPPAGSGVTATSRDTLPPVIISLWVMRSRFAVAKRPTAVTAAVRRGTTVRYVISEPGRVTFRIQRALRGRRVGRRCLPATARRRAARRCTRYKTVGSISRATERLTNRLAFSGRIGRKALRPGRYRIVAQAIDKAGNKSDVRSERFKVLRSRKR